MYAGTSVSQIAIATPEMMEAQLLTTEVWAAVHWVDSALGRIEMTQAWEIGAPVTAHLFDTLALGAVQYDFLGPDHASAALLGAMPAEWQTRS
jgi:hypothetical protein